MKNEICQGLLGDFNSYPCTCADAVWRSVQKRVFFFESKCRSGDSRGHAGMRTCGHGDMGSIRSRICWLWALGFGLWASAWASAWGLAWASGLGFGLGLGPWASGLALASGNAIYSVLRYSITPLRRHSTLLHKNILYAGDAGDTRDTRQRR